MNANEFIMHNVSSEPYNAARFAIIDFFPTKFDETKIPLTLIERANKDLALFANIEKNRFLNKLPIEGDAILRKDGKITFIGIFTYDGNFQDTLGGSFCIHEKGASYSGGFTMDVLNIANLIPSNTLTPLNCWIFSLHHRYANYGVYNTIHVKTWVEI